MSKAVLVIDIEEHGDYYVDVYRKDADDRFEGRYYLKPLRPLPERKDEGSVLKPLPFEVYMYRYGFNECLDEIIGETE